MKKLQVHNPVNLLGNNFAAAWRGADLAKEVILGEEVQLIDPAGQDLTYANVLDIWAGPLGHYPALLAEMMHDPLQRTFTGLHTYLMLHSGGDKTPLTTPVTILILEPKLSTIIRPSSGMVAGALKKGQRK
jgi:hypothetical protein